MDRIRIRNAELGVETRVAPSRVPHLSAGWVVVDEAKEPKPVPLPAGIAVPNPPAIEEAGDEVAPVVAAPKPRRPRRAATES